MAAVLVLECKSVHVAKIIFELRDLVINRRRCLALQRRLTPDIKGNRIAEIPAAAESDIHIAARASVQRQAVAHLLSGSTLAEPGRLVRSCIALAMLTCARRAAMAVSAFQRSAPETES
jgi:hypothetical protein